MAVMGGGKTVRAGTGLRTESANGMCELLSGRGFELRVPMFVGCAADETAHGRRQCGETVAVIPAIAENHGGCERR